MESHKLLWTWADRKVLVSPEVSLSNNSLQWDFKTLGGLCGTITKKTHVAVTHEDAYLREGQKDQDKEVKANGIQESRWGVAWRSELRCFEGEIPDTESH